jgi:hypothetical protein
MHCIFVSFFFFNYAIYEIMSKNIVEQGRPQITIGACVLHAGYLRLQTHTGRVIFVAIYCNSSCTNVPLCYGILTLDVLCWGFFFVPMTDGGFSI